MMLADADLAAVAELMSANRATLLLALLGGRALTAGELAGRARISRSLASSHLSRLLDGGLVTVEQHGRERH
jgi:DNA-binding transcriptional ArsR family regulator